MRLGKKAMANIGAAFFSQWAEYGFIIIILLGFALAISMRNPWLVYAVIFCAGMMSGRFIFERQGKQPLFPYLMILFGFLVGYLLGSFAYNKFAIVFLFVLGSVLSYYIHKEGYLG